jgi:HSP20 family protein
MQRAGTRVAFDVDDGGVEMADKGEAGLAYPRTTHDPFALLRQMTAELDRAFDEPFWPTFRLPTMKAVEGKGGAAWAPKVDVFEKDDRFVTRVDLPGVKKEDVTVEVTDGYLALGGTRTREKEEKKDNVFRTEREYGRFYRAIPLPEGVKLEEMKATFADGVLEVSVPLPARAPATVRKIEIQEPATAAKTAA